MFIFSLFKSRLKFLINVLREPDLPFIFVIFSFLVVGFLVALGVYLFLENAFLFLKNQPFFGPGLIVYSLEMAFALIFSILVVASTISGLVIFFKSDENRFLVTLPISSLKLFSYNFFKNLLTSSWPVFILAIPSILALGVSHKSPIYFYIFGFLGITIFLIFCIAIGSLLALIFGYFLGKVEKWYNGVVAILLLLCLGYLLANTLIPINLEEIFQAPLLKQKVVSTTEIEKNFAFWPSHILVNLLRHSLTLSTGQIFKYLLYLAGIAAVFGSGLLLVSGKIYFSVWTRLQERTFIAGRKGERTVRTKKIGFLRYETSQFLLFLQKDALTFLRNFNNLGSFWFMLFLVLVYILSVIKLSRFEGDVRASQYVPLILAANIGVTGYFAAILALRFVFPSLSFEGRSAWVLWSSPVNLKKIFWEKNLFYFLVFAILFEILFLFSFKFVIQDNFLYFILAGIVLVMLFCLVTVALGLGGLMPSFKSEDAESLSNTPGGIATTFTSIVYVAIVSYLSYFWLKLYFFEEIINAGYILLFLVISFILSFAFLVITPQKIKYIC